MSYADRYDPAKKRAIRAALLAGNSYEWITTRLGCSERTVAREMDRLRAEGRSCPCGREWRHKGDCQGPIIRAPLKRLMAGR